MAGLVIYFGSSSVNFFLAGPVLLKFAIKYFSKQRFQGQWISHYNITSTKPTVTSGAKNQIKEKRKKGSKQ